MLYELAHIVFPPADFPWWTDLFIRLNTRNLVVNKNYAKTKIYESNTWMNLFSAKKWYKYCELGELYLKLHIKGAYRLQIIGVDHTHAFGFIQTILVDTFIDSEFAEISIPNAKNYEGVSFTLFEEKENPIEIISAAWAAEKPPRVKNKLAIVSCTFKREQYINKTIAIFENFIKENAELKGRIKLFIVDNGKTLDASVHYEHTKIIPNMNAGGAGGFTRGLIEAIYLNEGMQKNAPYTRVLFMDDDIEILSETFYRTITLADYLREEYSDIFIHGSMMDLYYKNIFHEDIAVQKDFWVDGLLKLKDVHDLNNILQINKISETVSQNERASFGWWYCCFPISFAEKKGLPLPFFIRCDDVEWSWRWRGTHSISINGLCVWHAPFMWKSSFVNDFYHSKRNMFFTSVIHVDDFKNKFQKYFIDEFKYFIKTYNYIGIELFIRAMDDILKGEAAFKENPEEQFKSLNQIAKKIEYFPADNRELEQVKTYFPLMKKWKLLYKFTLHGKYLPSFLFKKESMALEWFPPVENFMLCKQVKVYNLLTGKYCIRKYDRKLIARYTKEFHKKLCKIKKNYDALKKSYEDAYKKLTDFNFWEKYLELK